MGRRVNADPHTVTDKSPHSTLSAGCQTRLLGSVNLQRSPARRVEMQRLPGNEGRRRVPRITAEKPVVVMAMACLLLVEPMSQVTTSVNTHQNVRVTLVCFRCAHTVPQESLVFEKAAQETEKAGLP